MREVKIYSSSVDVWVPLEFVTIYNGGDTAILIPDLYFTPCVNPALQLIGECGAFGWGIEMFHMYTPLNQINGKI